LCIERHHHEIRDKECDKDDLVVIMWSTKSVLGILTRRCRGNRHMRHHYVHFSNTQREGADFFPYGMGEDERKTNVK
jgi:hypothetical protein